MICIVNAVENVASVGELWLASGLLNPDELRYNPVVSIVSFSYCGKACV